MTTRKLFKKKVFAITGDLESGKSHKELGKLIKKLGGVYYDKFRGRITHLVSSIEDYSKNHWKVKRAKRKNIFVVHEDYVLDTYQENKKYNESDYELEDYVKKKNVSKKKKSSSKKSGGGKKRKTIEEIFPLEMWREILFFCTVKQLLLSLSCVNQGIHDLIDADNFWGSLCLRKLGFKFLCNRNRSVSTFPDKYRIIYDHMCEKSWKKVYQTLPDHKVFYEALGFCYSPLSLERPLRISRREHRKQIPNAFHFQNSKIGGFPLLLKGEEWPKCKCCERNMEFFFQVNTNEIPTGFPYLEKLPKDSLFQFFYCAVEDLFCMDTHLGMKYDKSKQDNKRFRWIHNLSKVGDGRGKYDIYKYHKNPWTEHLITEWRLCMDLPHSNRFYPKEELVKALKSEEDYNEDEEEVDECYLSEYVSELASNFRYKTGSFGGIKMFGFGEYINMFYEEENDEDEQHVQQLPDCPNKCGNKMRLMFELSECEEIPNIDWIGGYAFIHFCDHCMDQYTFDVDYS